LAILGIFTAFWIEVKLIPIMWILLFISPVVLLISYKALQDADCTIGEFRASGKRKND
jgi:hypothetical protein